jgi:glycosyltransferase involved in cell wall biosynthesis
VRSLHFSHFNTVNVPLTFCKVYEAMGHHGRLLTLYRHRGNIPEDICLGKKPFDPRWLHAVRRRRETQAEIDIAQEASRGVLHEFKPANLAEAAWLALRDEWRAPEFSRLARRYDLYGFDIYHFHGGIDFFRDSRWVRKLFAAGKPIVCHYHGPDLRGRGVVKAVDEASSLNLTSEFDLLALHPRLKYLAIPYDCSHLPDRAAPGKKLRIVHAPSNPAAKGTHLIEPVLARLARERGIEYAIVTGAPHKTVMAEKMKSHIAIEQIGNFGGTGYGVNSLETLAMNIPTVTEFTPDYEKFLPRHPFVLANRETLYDALVKLIDDEEYRAAAGGRGRQWVIENHSYEKVWEGMVGYMREAMPEAARRLMEEGGRG